MERRIDLSNLDLDRVEAAVSERRSAWSASGISDRPVTWTDNDTAWPVPITTRRSDVRRPRSLCIRIAHGQGEAEVIVYAGGWADVAVAPSDGGEIVQEHLELDTAEDVGPLLDRVVKLLTTNR